MTAAVGAGDDPNWTRAEKLVAQMTLDEKMQFVQGTRLGRAQNSGYVGFVEGVPRLGIPDLRLNDGPQGFRAKADGTSTQWPSGLTVARSWNRTLLWEWGDAIGAEFHGKGANVYFGPGLNVARLLNGGRSFEYLSGEDPFLGHQLVASVVAAVQARKVIANGKHYLNNNQEGFIPDGSPPAVQFGAGDRHNSSMNVAERVQMEIYLPPFHGAVQAGIASFMCANNLVNGIYACQNGLIQNGYLKNATGFKGFICRYSIFIV
jgi:beta-glucosidase